MMICELIMMMVSLLIKNHVITHNINNIFTYIYEYINKTNKIKKNINVSI